MKRFLILTLAALFVFNGCSSKGEATEKHTKEVTEVVTTEYFDFTVTEIVDALEECFIDFTAITIVDGEEKNEKIATYTSAANVFNVYSEDTAPMMHYMFTYDNATNKVSYISFFTDSQQTMAKEHFNYHILSLAECIDPNTNYDDLHDAIENNKIVIDDSEASSYYSENFTLHTHCDDNYFDANFAPPEEKTE